ncbi:MAG: TIGR01777 family oxidoreductase [Anaerolineae bacterium]|nr:TIGR01777 family oxidoreductase [Anaerolineae bacterium]
MRILITGGTGQVGKVLTTDLVKDGHEVIVLSRNPQKKHDLPAGVRVERWDGRSAAGWGHLADGAGAIINLAGENLAGYGFFPARWTEERKRLLRDSRVNAGKAVVEAVQAAKVKPGVVIQASAVGYYGPHNSGETLTEDAPAGTDFAAQICVEWEDSTRAVEAMGVRRVVTRGGVVLSFHEGALYRLALPFKLFAGGPMGSGKQPFPWIHPADQVGATRFLLNNESASGVFNLTAPEGLTNAAFGKVMGKVMGRPSFMPVPGFGMKLLFGEVAEMVLGGQQAVPQRLLDMGYTFRFPSAEAALRDLYQA